MKKFFFEYHSNEGMGADEAAVAENMAKWNKWFGSLGKALVDGGNPFAPGGMAVEKSGVSKVEIAPSTGYSIVNAASMDEAVEMAKGCPVVDAKGGAIRVYEALPM
jgi:hypothetical protein